MTALGAILSTQDLNIDGGAVSEFLVLAAPVTTVSATLEDMSGFSFTLDLAESGRIVAEMTIEAETTGGGTNAVGEWAIEINSVDIGAMGRFMSGTNDVGALTVIARSAVLGAGTYTVQGRHRRRTGDKTVQTNEACLLAAVVK